jgi:hypothetical protein
MSEALASVTKKKLRKRQTNEPAKNGREDTKVRALFIEITLKLKRHAVDCFMTFWLCVVVDK